jgi:hypothetical protein
VRATGYRVLPNVFHEVKIEEGRHVNSVEERLALEKVPPHQAFEGHPLDFDWRFTPVTTIKRAEALKSFSRPLLLGTPSVALQLQNDSRDFLLIDRQPLYEGRIVSFLLSDLCAPGYIDVPGPFDMALVDPPWYPEQVVRWINTALRMTERRAPIWIVAWTPATRPSAGEEYSVLLDALRSVGTIEIDDLAPTYQIPLFERAADDAHSARHGTLIRFQPRSDTDASLSELPLVSIATWRRFTFGGRQVAVRLEADSTGHAPKPRLSPIYSSGEWFQRSVSRRDPNRSLIDLWASNGFVAQLQNRRAFLSALEMISEDSSEALPHHAALARDLLRQKAPHLTAVLPGGKKWNQHDWMMFA